VLNAEIVIHRQRHWEAILADQMASERQPVRPRLGRQRRADQIPYF